MTTRIEDAQDAVRKQKEALTKAQADLKEAKREERRLQREEEQREYVKFKEELYKELKIVGHPKADQLFKIAWDYGHSSGYEEVRNYAHELVELIR